jgi:excisionase family DNA binding protein
MNQDRRDKTITEWMGLKQLTHYANVSERTLRAWIHAPVNPLPAVRVAGKILVRRSELDAWLARHRVKTLETLDLDGIVREALQGITHGRQSPKT